MSKKKNLTPTASVATCLDFAARVLSSKATVQDVCTKSVLAPMVVAAHRYGQQVMKCLEPGVPADARMLLRLLQSKQHVRLCRDSPLADLNVADLTWDFEGNVTDTLEMELKELQERATTNTTHTCVVFTASSLVSSGGQAVLWFPKESYVRNEDASPITSKKQQFLLYVCPGRVKVVKSVGDFIKKMYDELPLLRERDATYSVWAVVMGSSVSNQLEEASLKRESRMSKDDENGQNPIESVLKCSKSAAAANAGEIPTATNKQNQQRAETSPAEPNNQDRAEFVKDNQQRPETSSTEPNNQDRAESVKDNQQRPETSSTESNNQGGSESVKDDFEKLRPHSDDVDQDDSPPVSPRFSVYHDATDDKQYPAASIFSFGKRGVSDVRTKETDEECEDDKDTELTDDAKVVEDECIIPVDSQCHDLRPSRAIVSASLAEFSFRDGAASTGMEYDFGLGVRLKGNFVWQSCDGKVLRRSVRLHQTANCVKHDPKEPRANVLAEDSSDSDDDDAEFQNAVRDKTTTGEEDDRREEIKNKSEVFQSAGLQEQRRSTELPSHQEVNKFITPTGDTAPYLPVFTCEREFNAQTVDACQVSVGASTASPMKEPPTCASSVDAPCLIADGVEKGDCYHNDMTEPLTENLLARVQDEVPVVYVIKMEPLGQPDLVIERKTVAPPLKPKPAPLNYKDKLGAQIWWELEYTARKLEREEILERQEKARHRQGDNPIEGNTRIESRKAGHLNGPQRKEPTDTSKPAGSVNRKELPITSEKYVCGNQQDLLRGCITTVACESPAEQKIVDQVTALSAPEPVKEVSVLQPSDPPSRQSSEMKVSPCKLLSPFTTPKRCITSVACESPKEQKFVDQVTSSSSSGPVREVSVLQPKDPPGRQSGEMKVSPCKVLSPFTGASSSSSSRSEVDDSKNQEKSSRMSGGKLFTTEKHLSMTTTEPAVEEAQNLDIEQPTRGGHPTTLTGKSYESVSPGRKHSLKAAALHNIPLITPFVKPQHPETITPNNQEEGEDEKLAQMMWGSTRTSYEQDRNSGLQTSTEKEEQRATEIVPVLPFTARGRVPIRIGRASSRSVIPATNDQQEAPSSCNNTLAPPRNDTHTHRDQLKPHNPVTSPQASPAMPKPPPVTTFIVGEDKSSHNAITSSGTRQDRLNELRQKKLRKLQETRDLSIQQQKEKQQVRQPLSFASSVYSKKASNRQLIQNALEYTLLAGGSMERERTLALLALEQSTCDNFIVLLKSAKELKFRALYENHVDRDCATRIFSVLPSSSARAPMKIGSSDLISQFFKYSSGKKQFLLVSTRSLTVKTDACALADQPLFKNKQKSALARLLY